MPAPHPGDELRHAAAELVSRTCTEQGIPEHVEDPAVLRSVAAVLRSDR